MGHPDSAGLSSAFVPRTRPNDDLGWHFAETRGPTQEPLFTREAEEEGLWLLRVGLVLVLEGEHASDTEHARCNDRRSRTEGGAQVADANWCVGVEGVVKL